MFVEADGMSELEEAKQTDLQKLHQERQQLKEQVDAQAQELSLLRARFARYETALRGSQVIVFTQNCDLRYTSISNPMLGRSVDDILGRTDDDILPPVIGANIIAVKRETLATGEPKSVEIAVAEGPGTRWYDLHIESLRNDSGVIVGLTCVAVDVTSRKEGDAHLRLLLRELTHRSKNLLAVIQAMARQTARHSGSIDGFLNQFSSRLQALAASHDLLVRESWYGASLRELINSQLAGFIDHGEGQIALDGPEIGLKPEAAQNLALALHELVINAAKFGALSVPGGRVSISWSRRVPGDGGQIALEWREHHGPRVRPRRKRGFGSLVIERNLARSLDADVNLEFNAEGVRCQVAIPESQIVPGR
jgi:two-component sensor histidine kinase